MSKAALVPTLTGALFEKQTLAGALLAVAAPAAAGATGVASLVGIIDFSVCLKGALGGLSGLELRNGLGGELVRITNRTVIILAMSKTALIPTLASAALEIITLPCSLLAFATRATTFAGLPSNFSASFLGIRALFAGNIFVLGGFLRCGARSLLAFSTSAPSPSTRPITCVVLTTILMPELAVFTRTLTIVVTIVEANARAARASFPWGGLLSGRALGSAPGGSAPPPLGNALSSVAAIIFVSEQAIFARALPVVVAVIEADATRLFVGVRSSVGAPS